MVTALHNNWDSYELNPHFNTLNYFYNGYLHIFYRLFFQNPKWKQIKTNRNKTSLHHKAGQSELVDDSYDYFGSPIILLYSLFLLYSMPVVLLLSHNNHS